MSNILLIEDNEAIIMGLEYLFTNNGYNVRVARSAYQAKEICLTEN
jgi:DNA-binding response OmpR family regulator